MERDKLKDLYIKYELTEKDIYKHQHYLIITRQGIDKIQAKERIFVNYEVIKCEPNFAVVKAYAEKEDATIQTFGSALKGETFKDGNCQTWYVMEMAEKRAMSRAVLKLTGFYELGVFGEDESDDFKRKQTDLKGKIEELLEVKKVPHENYLPIARSLEENDTKNFPKIYNYLKSL